MMQYTINNKNLPREWIPIINYCSYQHNSQYFSNWVAVQESVLSYILEFNIEVCCKCTKEALK
jgi:hypothetical protein